MIDDNDFTKARAITTAWGLTDEEREQLLDRPSHIAQVIAINKALITIFEDRERADAWPRKANRAFQGQSALDLILDGDLDQVQKHLHYHMHNA